MAKTIFRFLLTNKKGVVAGIAYSALSFAAFFAGIGYGASCPEAGPQYCSNTFYAVIVNPYAFYVTMLHTLSWGALYYSLQQAALLVNPPPPSDAFITGPAAILLPLSMIAATFAIWAFAGAGLQELVRRSRGRAAPKVAV